MEWIKSPINSILFPEHSDKELMLLVRYQALYCQLEKEPNKVQLKRFFNPKQITFILKNNQKVKQIAENQIKNVSKKRSKDNLNYAENQQKPDNSAIETNTDRDNSETLDKKRLDKIKKDKKKVTSVTEKARTFSRDDILGWWNIEISQKFGLAKIQTITPTRQTALRNRIKEAGGVIEFKSLVSNAIMNSDFLRGENKQGWKADFDFCLQQKSFTKMAEGAYERKNAVQSIMEMDLEGGQNERN